MINNDHNNWQKEFKFLEGKHKKLQSYMKAMMEAQKKYEAIINANAAAMKTKDEELEGLKSIANEQNDFQEIIKSFEEERAAFEECKKAKDEEINSLKSQVNLLSDKQSNKIKSFGEERAAFEEYKMKEKAVMVREYLMLDEEWGEIWDKRRDSSKTDEDVVDDAEMLLKEPTEAGVDANSEIVSKDLEAKNSTSLDLTENVDKAEESPAESAKIRRRRHVAEDKLEEAVSKNSVSKPCFI